MQQTENDMRGQHLVVSSLEVIEDMSGKPARDIQSNIDQVRSSLVSVSNRAEKFYQDAASDNIITPEEKKTLKRDYGEIQRTYLAILQQAQTKGLSDDPRIIGLTTAYNALNTYLYTTIRVFEDMAENTVITSADDMNAVYNTYFDAQMIAQAVLTQTALAYVRVLDSLSDTGMDGELAYYSGQLFRYASGTGWTEVSSGSYIGVVNSSAALADAPDGSFFLAGQTMTVASYRIAADSGLITTDQGYHIGITKKAAAGEIWVLTEGIWKHVTDHNDWRYIIATNDLIALGYPISPRLEGHIQEIAQTTAEDIAGGSYLGPRTADPASPSVGDYYFYNGNTTSNRVNGYIYIYKKEHQIFYWQELNPNNTANYKYYMTALSDMMNEDEQSLDTGRFSVVFARSLAAMSAMIDTLMTQTLVIKEGGSIQSEVFSEQYGFRLTSQGLFECVNGRFNGNIDSGPLYLEKTSPGVIVIRALEGSQIYNSELILNPFQASVTCSLVIGSATPIIGTYDIYTTETVYSEQTLIRVVGMGTSVYSPASYQEIYKRTSKYKYYYLRPTGQEAILLGYDNIITTIYERQEWHSQTDQVDPAIETGERITYGKYSSDISATYNTDAWRMQLKNIPVGDSSSYEEGTVYRDINGTLFVHL